MNTTTSTTNTGLLIITDVLVLALVYFIPALSHLSPFPLYYIDPMRLLLFAAYLISRHKPNALLLAATIPLFSTLVTHHPPFYKAILIAAELMVNVALFMWMIKKIRWQAGIVMLIAAVLSKVFYYIAKYIFIQFDLVNGPLITTGLHIQLYTVCGLSLLFAIFFEKTSTRS